MEVMHRRNTNLPPTAPRKINCLSRQSKQIIYYKLKRDKKEQKKKHTNRNTLHDRNTMPFKRKILY
jgi:hypothetical protein